MKLTADQYYYVYFSMLEESAMLKPLSYCQNSSVFVNLKARFPLGDFECVLMSMPVHW